MRVILGWGGALLGSSGGWWLGAQVHLAVAVIVSAIVGAVGLYYGRRWFDDHLG